MFHLILYVWESNEDNILKSKQATFPIPSKNEIALLATFWSKGAFTINMNTNYLYLLDKHALTPNMKLQGRGAKDLPFL